MTAVKPSGRFGRLSFDEKGDVTHFLEKAQKDGRGSMVDSSSVSPKYLITSMVKR